MVDISVNKNNPFAAQDYATIINAYEKGTLDSQQENYALASYYKDVYSTKNFSQRAQEQFSYYPGLHQTNDVPKQDPYYTNTKSQSNEDLDYWNDAFSSPTSFMNALRDNQSNFNYQDIFGSDLSASDRATAIGKMLTECIPCFGRITDLNQLLPHGSLLNIHLLNVKARFDILDQIKKLFTDPGSYIDICQLLNFLSKQCPTDLFAASILLTQYLAKINLDTKFNIDFIVNLVGPILSPFLNALSQWLDKWMQLIVEPMICVVDHINTTIITAQQAQIPFSSGELNLEVTSNSNSSASNLLNSQAYQDKYPELPKEEIDASWDEMKQAWRPTETEDERRQKFDKIINKNKQEREAKEIRDINNRKAKSIASEEKYDINKSFGEEYIPPEKQSQVGSAESYFNPAPITDSLLQMRNVLQASIQYSNDWFTYITQMIYDLLGTDIGWMQKKTGTSYLKSQVLQLIVLIKAILEAYTKNGLKCGQSSNFDIEQMNYIFKNSINNYTDVQFEVNDNGDIAIAIPGSTATTEVENNSIDQQVDSNIPNNTSITSTAVGEISTKVTENRQKIQKSAMIVKNCLKGLSGDQLNEVQKWIEDYERSVNG